MREELVINQPAQLKALGSNVRLLITDWLLTHGPLSARELARNMGLRRTAIYHHLKVLLAAGLVEKAEDLDGDKFRPVAVTYRIDRAQNNPEWNEALGEMANCVLRGLSRGFRAAYLDPSVVRSDDPNKNEVEWQRSVFRLSPEELAEVNDDVHRVVNKAREIGVKNFEHPEVGKLYTFATFFVPEEEHTEDG